MTVAEKILAYCPEHFPVRAEVAFEDALSPDKRKKGRLARLTYEFDLADTMGKNRRIYPSELLDPEIARVNAIAQEGRLYGKVEHPKVTGYGPVLEELKVTLDNAATLIQSVEKAGAKKVRVVEDVLDNPFGQQLASILRAGGDPGLSQRAAAYWEPATDDEKVKYGLAKDDPVSIARFLRLVTYDNVAEPGYPDAHVMAATESASTEDPPMKTVAEFKAAHPELHALVLAAGRDIGLAEMQTQLTSKITEAVEAAKAPAVEAATKPLQTQLDTARAESKPLKEAMESVIAVLGEKGMLNPADAQAATQIAEGKSKLAVAEVKLAETTAALEAAKQETAKLKGKVVAAEAMAAVEAKYGPATEHKAHWPLIKPACEGAESVDAALSKAAARLADIKAIAALESKGNGNGSSGSGNPPANGGEQPKNDGAIPGRSATARILGGGLLMPG